MNGSITGLYAALLALLVIVLGYRIVGLRRSLRVGIGDGGQPALMQAIRAHANLVEYAPIGLVMLLAAELSAAAPAVVLHGIGAAFVLARAGHAFGLSTNPNRSPGRFYGTLVTWIVLIALAALLIIGALR
jgi:hypothetical protein